MSEWTKSDEQMPELSYPRCQDCQADPFRKIPDEVYAYGSAVKVCRHRTNIHWSLPEHVLVGHPGGRDPSIYWYVVDYRGENILGDVSWRRSWAGTGSLSIKGTVWMPLPKLPPAEVAG